MKNFEYSLFQGVFNTQKIRDIIEEALVEDIRLDKYKIETDTARELLLSGNKKAYDEFKREKLPAITPNVYYSDRRIAGYLDHYTSRMFFDIDHIDDPEELQGYIEALTILSNSVLVYKSLSGEGAHVFLKVLGVNDDNFKPVYEILRKMLEGFLEHDLDPNCCNPGRLCILNHDPDVYYNPDAIALDAELLMKEKELFTQDLDFQTMEEHERLKKYLDKVGSIGPEGSRHTNLVSLAGTLNQLGFDEGLVVEMIIERYAEPGFGEKEICKTVKDIYLRYDYEHGIRKKVYDELAESSKAQKSKSSLRDEELKVDDFEEEEEDMEKIPCPSFESYQDKIPYILKTGIDPQESEEIKFTHVLSNMVAMGCMMPHVTIYAEKEIYPMLLLIVRGDSGSGKSAMTSGVTLSSYHKNRVEALREKEIGKSQKELEEWEKCMAKWKSDLKNKDNKQDECSCGEKPVVPPKRNLISSANISMSKLISNMKANEPFPTLIIEYEIDTANRNNKQDFGGLSEALRKISEHETITSNTQKNGDICLDTPKSSGLLSGTDNQVIRLLDNKEDGLVNRPIYIALPVFSSYRPLPEYNRQTEALKEALRSRVETYSVYFEKHELKFYLSEEDRKQCDDYIRSFDDRCRKTGESLGAARRLRSKLLRLTAILTAIKLCDENRTSGEYPMDSDAFQLVLSWCDFLFYQTQLVIDMLPDRAPEKGKGRNKKQGMLYDNLPCKFDFATGREYASRMFSISVSTFKRYLSDWNNNGFLEKEKHNRYKKTKCHDTEQD